MLSAERKLYILKKLESEQTIQVKQIAKESCMYRNPPYAETFLSWMMKIRLTEFTEAL